MGRVRDRDFSGREGGKKELLFAVFCIVGSEITREKENRELNNFHRTT